MARTVKVNARLSIGYANASRHDELEVEVPDNCTPAEREKLIDEAVQDWIGNYLDWSWVMVD
jgi:hypothetical protein